jgi:hypothetical protein
MVLDDSQMARELKTELVKPGLRDHVSAQATEIHIKYGPELGWDQLRQLLEDRSFVPYSCEIRFDAGPLLPGEFAHPFPRGQTPDDGYIIYIHPYYSTQLSRVPLLVLHQLALINYGDSATLDDAETFGSLALGLSKEEYYHALCELSAQIGGDELI